MKKTEEFLKYTTKEGKEIQIPLVTLVGDEPGPTGVFTAGIHGCEFPPILAASEFCRTVDLSKVKGTVKIVTICTLPSFETQTPFINPVDGKNPNRFFPGDLNGSYTEELTWHIFNDIIKDADYHMDLHCGDLTENLVDFCEVGMGFSKEVDEKCHKLALYCGAQNLVETDFVNPTGPIPPGMNFMNSCKNGVAAGIFEVGQMCSTEREYVDAQLFCIQNVMRAMGNLEGEAVPSTEASWFTTYDELYSPDAGIFVRCVKAGDEVKAGQKVGDIYDYFGNHKCEVKCVTDGRILYMTAAASVTKGSFVLDMVH